MREFSIMYHAAERECARAIGDPRVLLGILINCTYQLKVIIRMKEAYDGAR